MNLYFVRHGETIANASHVLAGHLDAKLNEDGVKQAEGAAEDIKRKQIAIDLILSSPLTRTLQTARIIAKTIGYPADKIDVHYELIERDFGNYTGHALPPSSLLTFFAAEHADPSVETLDHLMERAKRVLDEIRQDHANHSNILLVSHSVIGEALIAQYRGYPWGRIRHMHKPPNGKVIKL